MPTRRPLIAGNWKMYMTAPEVAGSPALRACAEASAADVDLRVAPPFTSLPRWSAALAGSGVAVGAQDMHRANEGAFTGEVSPRMIKDVGARHVIVGHTERRQLFGETDGDVASSLDAAFATASTSSPAWARRWPSARRGGPSRSSTASSSARCAASRGDQARRLVVAYEPVWAIGTGLTATPAAGPGGARPPSPARGPLARRGRGGRSPHPLRRQRQARQLGALMAEPDVDGALVGGASLTAASFLKIVHYPPA